jgi:hypothetical protein
MPPHPNRLRPARPHLHRTQEVRSRITCRSYYYTSRLRLASYVGLPVVPTTVCMPVQCLPVVPPPPVPCRRGWDSQRKVEAERNPSSHDQPAGSTRPSHSSLYKPPSTAAPMLSSSQHERWEEPTVGLERGKRNGGKQRGSKKSKDKSPSDPATPQHTTTHVPES